jgi:hypothetical protein
MINVIKKWKVKNHFSFAESAVNPYTHCTVCDSVYRFVDSKLVITVAPQNYICPPVNTYPTNSVAVVKNGNIIHMSQV